MYYLMNRLTFKLTGYCFTTYVDDDQAAREYFDEVCPRWDVDYTMLKVCDSDGK